MVSLSNALALIAPRTLLVVGDLILDNYVFGQSKRISPEAPVPVVLSDREESRAGGAGNVALNLVSLGMRPRLLSRVGRDPAGRHVLDILAQAGVDISGVVEDESFITPVKTRVIASAQQLVRIDRETSCPLSLDAERMLIDRIPDLCSGASLVAISDYAKGTLSRQLLSAVIRHSKKHNIPVLTDPKGPDFSRYAHSTLLKPNSSETFRAAPPHTTGSLEEAAKAILDAVPMDVLMVTRSEEGISLFYPDGGAKHFPVHAREVRDTTGAGDTVLATLSAAYASGVPLEEAVHLSNIAASCSVERVGCARVSTQDIAARILENSPSGKICHGTLFHALLPTLRSEKILFIQVESPQRAVSPDHLIRLSELSRQHADCKSIVCFPTPVQDVRFLQLVAALSSTHLVVHDVSLDHHSLPQGWVLAEL